MTDGNSAWRSLLNGHGVFVIYFKQNQRYRHRTCEMARTCPQHFSAASVAPARLRAMCFCAATMDVRPMSHNTFRPSLSGHHLGREPWAGDRLRRRRLPARYPSDNGGHSDLPRQAPARPIALHHPAPRAGCGAAAVGRLCRRQRTAGDDGHTHFAADRQRRPARHATTPTSRTNSALVTPISPTGRSTASATIAAADDPARARRRCAWRRAPLRARSCPGVTIRGRARSGRPAQDRSRALVLERGRQQPLLLARSRHRRDLVQLPRRRAQGGLRRSAP